MDFEEYTAAQYRELDYDALEARRQEILRLSDEYDYEAAEHEVDITVIDNEARMCQAEIERRNRHAGLRNAQMEQLLSGNAPVIERCVRTGNNARTQQIQDRFDTTEYRNAFMNYVCRGVPIPMELRTDPTNEVTMTTDVLPQIPTTMAREIITKMSEYGTIWNSVRKLSVQGGVTFRTVDLALTASWIGENEVSLYQKVEDDDLISFLYHQLECRLAQTLLAQATTYADFQAMFVPATAEAMVRTLEQAIVRGNGTKKPLGIINDNRIVEAQRVTLSAAQIVDWKEWRRRVKAAIPKSYRNGSYIMAQSTWDTYIETMSDDQNAPVSIGYNPVTGVEEYRLMGRPVITVEPDILPDFDDASTSDVFCIYGDLSKYAVNTQPGMPMTTKRWIDDDTNQEKIKALVAIDGKVLDPHGFLLVSKAASL